MEKEEKEKLRRHLKKKIADLKQNIQSYKGLTKPVPPDNAIGRLTRMDALNSKSVNEAALKKAKLMFSRFEQVLSAIDDPDFGVCVDCDEPIPFGRLLAMPGTNLCVPCAEKIDGS